MAKANRETLKGYFGDGKRPTGSQFGDLVDSMLNIVDDGLNRQEGGGLQLSPLEESGPVLEFFSGILDEKPLWEVRIDREREVLEIAAGGEEKPVFSLFRDGRMVLDGRVEVDGPVKASSFQGGYRCGEIPADGAWHDITEEDAEELSGCRAYRVMAGCGRKGKGKYALAEVTAMHCYGKRRRVYYRQSWFGMHFNRLKVRWHRTGKAWRLQLRTRCDYGEGVLVRYRVTELWQDYFMNG